MTALFRALGALLAEILPALIEAWKKPRRVRRLSDKESEDAVQRDIEAQIQPKSDRDDR